MLNVPEEKLKITIHPNTKKYEGLEIDIANEFIGEMQGNLHHLNTTTRLDPKNPTLQSAYHLLQSEMIQNGYDPSDHSIDSQENLLLAGENGSEFRWETLQNYAPKICSPELFARRTRLKIQRTKKNIAELLKQNPNHSELEELQEMLENLNLNVSADILHKQVVAISEMPMFTAYVEQKKSFLQWWVNDRREHQGKGVSNAFEQQELGDMIQVLSQQNSKIGLKSEVLRYKNHQYFQNFNLSTHDVLHSDSLEFWQTEKNLQSFLRFMLAIRMSFDSEAPFYVFRFENSFAYLLCGFSNESLVYAMEHNQPKATIHAKILLRQTNQAYRELRATPDTNLALYHNCLKEGMLPFVQQLNRRLQIGLEDSFLNFFQVY